MEKPEVASEKAGCRQETTVASLVSEFASSTTAHGIGRIAAAPTTCRRTFWTLASLAFYVALCYMCIEMIVLFRRKPVISKVQVASEERIDFPAVTICNLNMLQLNKIHGSGAVEEFLKYVSEEENSDGTKATPGPTRQNTTNIGSAIKQKISRWEESRRKLAEAGGTNSKLRELMSNAQIDHVVLRAQYFDRITKSLSEASKVRMGQSFAEMVKRCRWAEYRCDKGSLRRLWRHFWHWKYGNCYTFNSGRAPDGHEMPILSIRKAGPYAGLELFLLVDQLQYTALSDEAGMRVVLTDQGKMPFPFEDGFSVAPGFSTTVSIRKVHTQRVDVFGNKSCLDETNKDFNEVYQAKYNVTYSVQACMIYCISGKIADVCNCSLSRYPTQKSACIGKEQVECAEEVIRTFRKGNDNCPRKCPQPCLENTFRYTISSSQWSQGSIAKLRNKFHSARDRLRRRPRTPRPGLQVKDNVLKLQIFYEEMTVEKIIHQQAYKIENLLADIGGHLGLWIGVSVMTIAELLELIVSVAGILLRRMRPQTERQ